MLIAPTLQLSKLTLPMQWLKWETLAHSLAPVARSEPTAGRPTKVFGLLLFYYI